MSPKTYDSGIRDESDPQFMHLKYMRCYERLYPYMALKVVKYILSMWPYQLTHSAS